MYTHTYKVRMSDTDMAGILFFPHQLQFIHFTIEDFFESLHLPFDKMFKENDFVFVVVHAESDYLKPLHVGDILHIILSIKKLGTTSLHFHFDIQRDSDLVGTAETVHVCLHRTTREKMAIPPAFKELLAHSV